MPQLIFTEIPAVPALVLFPPSEISTSCSPDYKFKTGGTSRVQPFAHALFGASLFRGFTSDIRPSGNVYTIDDATSLAMALGGGVDVRLNRRIDFRLIQVDYTPTFFESGRQNNIRVSVGIVFKR